MNEICNKSRCVLIGSVALNIFLVAFILGRVSMHQLPPPPPPPFARGEMPPPPFDGGPGGPHGGPHGDMMARGDGPPPPPPGEHGHMPPPPPPFFAPADLFSPAEMEEGFAKMRENFTKVEALREDFAKQLKEGNVTKEQALAHFTQVDGVMDGVKKEMQEKAAEKIGAMSPDERQRFADRLVRKP